VAVAAEVTICAEHKRAAAVVVAVPGTATAAGTTEELAVKIVGVAGLSTETVAVTQGLVTDQAEAAAESAPQDPTITVLLAEPAHKLAVAALVEILVLTLVQL
jgi:hypothetical protein